MRTTLTLDDDVAIKLEKLRRDEHLTLRGAINAMLRRGLTSVNEPRKDTAIEIPTVNLGGLLIPSIECYGEVLDFMEEAERHDSTRR